MISAGGSGARLLDDPSTGSTGSLTLSGTFDEQLDCSASLDEDAFCLSLELDSALDSMADDTGSSTGLEDVSSPHATRNAVKARAKNPKRFISYSFTHPKGNIITIRPLRSGQGKHSPYIPFSSNHTHH